MKEFGAFPRLETNRLILRRMTFDDLAFYFYHFNLQQIVDGCCFLGPDSLETAKDELERYCIKPFIDNRGIRWESPEKGPRRS